MRGARRARMRRAAGAARARAARLVAASAPTLVGCGCADGENAATERGLDGLRTRVGAFCHIEPLISHRTSDP